MKRMLTSALCLLIGLSLAVPVFPAYRVSGQAASGPGVERNFIAVPLLADPHSTGLNVPARVFPGGLAPQSAAFAIDYIPAGSTNAFGYTCLAWPAEAQTAFAAAAAVWGSLLTSPVTIRIEACWADMGSPSILGASATLWTVHDDSSLPQANTSYPIALANALAGFDYAPPSTCTAWGYPTTVCDDMTIVYNSGFAPNFFYGTGGGTPAGDYDFMSIVLHEIGHGLGFAGSMCVSGGLGDWGGCSHGAYPASYDRFAYGAGGMSLLDPSAYPRDSAALATALTSSVTFRGENAKAAFANADVPLYTPGSWSQGSSYSHLAELFNAYSGGANALMTYSIGTAEWFHDPGPVGMGVLRDVGWAPFAPTGLTAIPVSSTQINLGWTDTNLNESGYKIERATSPGGPWTLIHTTGPNATDYADSDGLSPSTLYYYRVRAFHGLGESLNASTQVLIPVSQADIFGPGGSGQFGYLVKILPNGNIVVTDPLYDSGSATDTGAVYLYDGRTLELISTLTGGADFDYIGGREIVVLPTGDFVVASDSWGLGMGAVTWCSGVSGCSGQISVGNSLVGSTAGDHVGQSITVLANGSYVVASPDWNAVLPDTSVLGQAGAVTWCSGVGGCVGQVSASNSLVGGTALDQVGRDGAAALPNGNYVVLSSQWSRAGQSAAGAATWCGGESGCTGVVSLANSLVGSTASDKVGSSVVLLSNGNYVVASPAWHNGGALQAGAVTWCGATSACLGSVSAGNSLVGSSGNDSSGQSIVSIGSGRYVVANPGWDDGDTQDVGAVTWCSAAGGCTGEISAAASLAGVTTGDRVGEGGVRALTNGNYAVASPGWDDGGVADVGAVTWCGGTGGCVDQTIGPGNSLTGSHANDRVGNNGVTALSNGNYVVSSYYWANGSTANAGAATWCSGGNGCQGEVGLDNSLVGTSAQDYVGRIVTALPNGNYVVDSYDWNYGTSQHVGAVTWCSGTAGCRGPVSDGSSLVGLNQLDAVGSGGIVALASGDFVVASPAWNNNDLSHAGAVTWCSGTSGCPPEAVSFFNSLVGSRAWDGLGSGRVTALARGGYVVASPYWDTAAASDVGAISWCPATGGCQGEVTPENSLVGSTANDHVGIFDPAYPLRALANGNYLARLPDWNNGGRPVGAIVLGAGFARFPVGEVNDLNSLLGGDYRSTENIVFDFDPLNDHLVAGFFGENRVSVLKQPHTSQASGSWATDDRWNYGVPGPRSNVLVAGEHTITSSGNINTLDLMVDGVLAVGGGLAVDGTFSAGGGTLIYNGTSPQLVLGGPYKNLQLNNASGASLGGGVIVESALVLTQGRLSLEASDLTLGLGAGISGIAGVDSMLVTGAAGRLCKQFSEAASFTYPLGDTTGTPEYSPATLSFSAGTFDPGAACMQVTNVKLPSNPSSVNYLNRYWTVTQTGMRDFSAQLSFDYLPADVTGSEALLYTWQHSGSTWVRLGQADSTNHRLSGTVSGFSEFTGGDYAPNAVLLSGLNGVGLGSQVRLEWSTLSEASLVGFNIYRASGPHGLPVRLNSQLIPAQDAGGSGGARYAWVDPGVLPGGLYFYWVEWVGAGGQTILSSPLLVPTGHAAWLAIVR